MDAIIVLLGLVIGIIIFLFLMDRITAIIYNCSSVAFTFFICWAIGIVLAWIAWKIAVIVGFIILILLLISRFTEKKNANQEDNNDDVKKAENIEN